MLIYVMYYLPNFSGGVVSKGTWGSYYQASVTITLGRRV